MPLQAQRPGQGNEQGHTFSDSTDQAHIAQLAEAADLNTAQ